MSAILRFYNPGQKSEEVTVRVAYAEQCRLADLGLFDLFSVNQPTFSIDTEGDKQCLKDLLSEGLYGYVQGWLWDSIVTAVNTYQVFEAEETSG